MTFVEAVQKGLINYEDIDDYIVAWHKSNSSKDIDEYLGMTEEQYFKFGTNGIKALRQMFPRKNNSGKD